MIRWPDSVDFDSEVNRLIAEFPRMSLIEIATDLETHSKSISYAPAMARLLAEALSACTAHGWISRASFRRSSTRHARLVAVMVGPSRSVGTDMRSSSVAGRLPAVRSGR